MKQYIARRLGLMVPLLFGISVIVFVFIRLIPGDPAELMASQWATKKDIELIRHAWGLDRPLHVQYLVFLWNLARGDLGRSVVSNTPVTREIRERYPYTIQLAVASMAVAIAVGTAAGVISAVRPYALTDNLSMVLALLGVSTPGFWMGLMMMLLFAVILGWLPATGAGTIGHLVMPAATLGFAAAGILARQTRSSMLDVLRQEYIFTARAKGLREAAVIGRHGLKNALIPVVTVVGLQFGTLLGGSVVIESVFAWPGMGRLLVDAIMTRDYPVIQAAVLLFATTFAVINLAVDLLYGYLDPRIRYG
ncbi:MAG: ABC transporter permease [Armatimonadota bacterium]|nr:ABC transporter permease [Armatimonadota bacterium]